MRLFVGLILACVASSVFAVDITTPQDVATSSVDERGVSQAKEVLERWEDTLSKTDSSSVPKSSTLRRAYLDAWATTDLDRAIDLEKKYRCRWSQLRMAERLAGAHRWDDLEAYVHHYENASYFSYGKFWARVACYGARIGDPNAVELAGRRVEAFAAAQPREAGKPPRPARTVAMARFFVAASRLHLARGELKLDQLPEFKLTGKQREKTRLAVEDLWRAAGSVVPQRSVFTFAPNVSGVRGFAALESWAEVSRDGFYRFNPQDADNFAAETVKQFEPERDSLVVWPRGVRLPDVSQTVTSAWLVRQTLLGRTDVALTCIWLAPGSDVDRARQLAVVSRYLPAGQQEQKALLRRAAYEVVMSTENIDDAKVRALAELALAFSAAGDAEKAKTCIDATADAYPDGGGYNKAIEYETNQVLLQAIAALSEPHARLSEVLERRNRRFDPTKLTRFEFAVGGLTRRVDLSRVVPESMYGVPFRYASHKRYHQFRDGKNWPEALLEAGRLAKGNPAWASSYPKLGVMSVRDIGLVATLDWCKDIPDTRMRMAAEVAAIREVLRNRRKTLPALDSKDPQFIAPAISWPSGC